tara:strand:+ start:581 stop:802 length:222 start_codon:yes stop_codon:yes gene_type:complete
MLRTLYGQQQRNQAIKWLTDAQQKCGYGQMIYVQNTMHRYLAGSVNEQIELLTWTLQAPKAVKRQAVKKKRRL